MGISQKLHSRALRDALQVILKSASNILREVRLPRTCSELLPVYAYNLHMQLQ